MLEVEASFDFPWNFFFLREQILDLLQPMVGRAKSQKKKDQFGSLVFGAENGRNTYS